VRPVIADDRNLAACVDGFCEVEVRPGVETLFADGTRALLKFSLVG
jgi:hypothetical protein